MGHKAELVTRGGRVHDTFICHGLDSEYRASNYLSQLHPNHRLLGYTIRTTPVHGKRG